MNTETITHENDWVAGFETGYRQGYECGRDDGWGLGYDAATKEVLS